MAWNTWPDEPPEPTGIRTRLIKYRPHHDQHAENRVERTRFLMTNHPYLSTDLQRSARGKPPKPR